MDISTIRPQRIDDGVRWVLTVPVPGPLGHVPAHIEHTPGIRLFALDGMRFLTVATVPCYLIQVWLLIHGREITELIDEARARLEEDSKATLPDELTLNVRL